MILRLDKYLADMGCGARSQVKQEIKKGSVLVNGQPAKRPEQKVDSTKDRIDFQGRTVSYTEYEYYMLNKPAGVVSATRDPKEKTVLDLIESKTRNDLFPVGRLDKDTEGLLLITNDGAMSHRLLSPKKHVDKVYFARVSGTVTEQDAARFRAGLDIGDEKPTMPAELEILSSGRISEVRIVIREGRFHQVKRMFEAVGKQVVYLKREKMGTLSLDDTLCPGQYRKLTEKEVNQLC